MGGEGSGRRPDPVKRLIEQHTATAAFTTGEGIFLPNLSGVKHEIAAGTKADHNTDGNVAEVVNVCYGTGAAPAASTVPIGTIYILYTP